MDYFSMNERGLLIEVLEQVKAIRLELKEAKKRQLGYSQKLKLINEKLMTRKNRDLVKK